MMKRTGRMGMVCAALMLGTVVSMPFSVQANSAADEAMQAYMEWIQENMQKYPTDFCNRYFDLDGDGIQELLVNCNFTDYVFTYEEGVGMVTLLEAPKGKMYMPMHYNPDTQEVMACTGSTGGSEFSFYVMENGVLVLENEYTINNGKFESTCYINGAAMDVDTVIAEKDQAMKGFFRLDELN